MTPSNTNPPIPSELDDEVSNADLPSGHILACPCKLPSYFDYGNAWTRRNNFLVHLQEKEAHTETALTPPARRAVGI
jgi:hypothetical protein